MPITEAAVERADTNYFTTSYVLFLQMRNWTTGYIYDLILKKIMKIAAREQSMDLNLEIEIISCGYESRENL